MSSPGRFTLWNLMCHGHPSAALKSNPAAFWPDRLERMARFVDMSAGPVGFQKSDDPVRFLAPVGLSPLIAVPARFSAQFGRDRLANAAR